ncbi:hypothetical protein KUCAC02_008626 [Chaenocephalus aceratus]|uniref:Uncharacterized protein n=1 Tax=Chaenocephalus aceratus TaxID=36190 RepID=A0ACB9WSU4_CHAAC|nr:hypothetical protein KUCAC02_008626 [Chaenocephalus aceratus]
MICSLCKWFHSSTNRSSQHALMETSQRQGL